MMLRRASITGIIVICCAISIVSSCNTSQDEIGLHEETDLLEETGSSQMKSRTVPSGYLELTVTPAEVYADTGEQIEIRCAIYSLVNTPVEITSVELVVFDSDESLLREQAMTKDSYWSAHTLYTIAGDEAYYRLKVNFTTPYADPGEYSEYTADSFPIVVNREGG